MNIQKSNKHSFFDGFYSLFLITNVVGTGIQFSERYHKLKENLSAGLEIDQQHLNADKENIFADINTAFEKVMNEK